MKTLICIPVFNRPAITRICLGHFCGYLPPDSFCQVTNDGSTDPEIPEILDNLYLHPPYGEIINQKHQGIHQTRANQIQYFLNHKEFDYLYLTDSDAFHDWEWFNKIEEIYALNQDCISLYKSNTGKHALATYGNTAPGCSMFVPRVYAERLYPKLKHIARRDWDWQVYQTINRWRFPEYSQIEHYGAGGLNNRTMEADRAHQPTEFLKEHNEWIMEELKFQEGNSPWSSTV